MQELKNNQEYSDGSSDSSSDQQDLLLFIKKQINKQFDNQKNQNLIAENDIHDCSFESEILDKFDLKENCSQPNQSLSLNLKNLKFSDENKNMDLGSNRMDLIEFNHQNKFIDMNEKELKHDFKQKNNQFLEESKQDSDFIEVFSKNIEFKSPFMKQFVNQEGIECLEIENDRNEQIMVNDNFADRKAQVLYEQNLEKVENLLGVQNEQLDKKSDQIDNQSNKLDDEAFWPNQSQIKFDDQPQYNDSEKAEEDDDQFVKIDPKMIMEKSKKDKNLTQIVIKASLKKEILQKDEDIKLRKSEIFGDKACNNSVFNKINNFIMKASTNMIKNQISKVFPYSKAAHVLGDAPDQFIQISEKQNFCKIFWIIKNESKVNWENGLKYSQYSNNNQSKRRNRALSGSEIQGQQDNLFDDQKAFKLFVTYYEPQEVQVTVEEFDYQPLDGQENGILELQLEFINNGNLNKMKSGLIMMRILDDKNVIMGDAKEDNLLIFIKIGDNEERGEKQFEQQENQLLAMASILMDEGYSQNFDRCFKAVSCCGGDIDQARDLLSKITITENQYY